MEKIDFKKELKELYSAPRTPVIVDVPRMMFLMIDGKGAPEGESYQQAIQVLYNVSFTVKFALKKRGIINYTVMPLESLWWMEGDKKFDLRQRDAWCWTAMIMQPEQVTTKLVNKTIQEIGKKKNLPDLKHLRFEPFREGLSAQIMHVGPYSAEGPTIEKLHEFIQESGYTIRGRHHEIYLSDPRRTAPERLKTILRQPIK